MRPLKKLYFLVWICRKHGPFQCEWSSSTQKGLGAWGPREKISFEKGESIRKEQRSLKTSHLDSPVLPRASLFRWFQPGPLCPSAEAAGWIMDWEERLGRSLRLIGWPVVGSKSPRWLWMSIPAEGHPAGPSTFWIWFGKRQEQDGPLLSHHLRQLHRMQGLVPAPRPQWRLCVCCHLPACGASVTGSLQETARDLRTFLPKWGGAEEVVAPSKGLDPGHFSFLVVS